MILNLQQYKSVVFDCDGVLLNSNKIKTQAFYNVALRYGEKPAQLLVDYHVRNGGVSRYKKFVYLLTAVLGKDLCQIELDLLLAGFAEEVKKRLMVCEVADGLYELREKTQNVRWHVVSGGDQDELRDIFLRRSLTHLFDGGIFGSPDTKEQILQREIKRGNIKTPACFLGDTQYDFKASKAVGLNFIFISGWSEMEDWKTFCEENRLQHYISLSQVLLEH
jgi:phosphoglycolate phosphatase-like HAD superfamily hydrolase